VKNAVILFLFVAACFIGRGREALASEDVAWAALREGAVALVRHAVAPGVGDPAGMRIGDCTTQRNLDGTGRAQAARIGAAFANQDVVAGRVLTSQWCRTVDTAAIAFPGKGELEPAFNSFFGARSRQNAQSQDAMRIIQAWRGPGALVIVTHQVNITALTGVVPASGEAIVVRPSGARLETVGRLSF
jgi:phosphohistidine phosphatase SixA